MKEKSKFDDLIIKTFIESLQMILLVEPLSDEWNFLWNLISSSKKWFEDKKTKEKTNS